MTVTQTNQKSKRESKAERMAKVVAKTPEKPGETPAVPATPAPTPEPTAPVVAVQAEPTPKKKASKARERWREQRKMEVAGSAKISNIQTPCPKSRGAVTRYSYYAEGQTVDEYVTASHKHGHSKALALADVKWDYVHGFICLDGKKYVA